MKKERTLQDLANDLDKLQEEMKQMSKKIEPIKCPIKMYVFFDGKIGIPFNNNRQVLYIIDGCYVVDTQLPHKPLFPCNLTPCKREDLEPDDTAFCMDNKQLDFTELEGYCKILNDKEHVWTGRGCVYVSDEDYEYWYKVERA